ncbi:RND transporter, Hydrophobe/Amphiphile Efflux-1 (HAE1)/Heavy Metal Efflux (HME) family, permease protein [Leptospira fainei serovar Hurstbridge str. BUT 6]|uniref:RND transporter, Hydrophobe/Amphiphile Efflux-1 (HAE1)/Heavy Metal Efflux (HME) family, permease protein n=1 Tax=Leptospira fainei serovar Hurstbridge str. BUT 6 TaxID=1193011 RepID=S3UWZ1_9LEPT|nr:efflux RND transporter permease subunit [Leptospira fainei]EPG73793.1 RND transporter, Hydrophobe/Amphiphile Efflux-1 (HAE1)/Heavy Metal Efflux (HME) family, permease protein [Leptospira fainei serovar Hurstbridge str. BUT 6]
MSNREKSFLNRHPLTVAMILSGFFLFGVLSFFKVPVTLFPTSAYPGLSISVEYPGADVLLVEEILAVPIEEAVSSVGGIEELRSSAERGRVEINIEFQKGTNIDIKGLEIRERVDAVASNFPREAHKPLIFQYDPDQKPIIIISIESKKFDFTTLRSIADHEVKRYLENIEGVSQIAASGGKVREVLIACDLQKLRAYGLDLQDIQRVIQTNNKSASIGAVEKNGLKYNLLLSGKYQTIRDIQTQPFYSPEMGRVFFLQDVADVSFSFRDEESASRVSGKEMVSIFVYKSSLGNTMQIASEVRNKLQELRLPDVTFSVVYDQSESVRKTYSNILTCTLLGILLIAFLHFRNQRKFSPEINLTLFLQLPLNFFIIQFFLFLSKIDFDLIIASAEIIGYGLWFFVYKFLCERRDSAQGSFKLRNTIGEFASFIIIILSLCLPLYYLDSDTGQSTMRLGAFLSLYLSLSYFLYIPLYSSVRMVQEKYFRSYSTLPYEETRISRNRGSAYDIFPKRIFLAAYLIVISAGVFRLIDANKELFYSTENRKVIGFVELPAGFNFAQTNSITKKIEEKLLKTEGTSEVTSKVEPGHSLLVITVDESKISGDDFIQKIRKDLGNVSPAFCYFSRESESSRYKEIKIDVLGDDYDTLDQLTKDLAGKASGISGSEDTVLNYKSPRDELELSLNNNKASGASLNNSEIAGFLKTAIQGSVVSKFMEDSRELDIKIRAQEGFRKSPSSIEKFVVKNQIGKYVPIPEVSSKKESRSPARIFRKNKKRVLSFSLRTTEASYHTIKTKIIEELSKNLPENYHIELGRGIEKILEAENRLYAVIAFSFLLIYMVFASYFESFLQALEVIATILFPFFLTLLITSFLFGKLSLPVYLGLLLTIAAVSFQILCLGKVLKDPEPGFKRRTFLLILALFAPQLLFSSEGGSFLMEMELTLLLGIGISLVSTPKLYLFLEGILPKQILIQYLRENLFRSAKDSRMNRKSFR